MAQWRREARQEALRVRRRVLLVGVALVAIAAATTSALVVAANHRERELVRERLGTQAREGAALVDAFLAGEIQTLRAVASAPAVVSGDRTAMRDFFRRIDPAGADAGGGIVWIDREGKLQVLLATPNDAPPADLSHREYVARTLATREPVVSDALISGGTVPIVVVTVPTFDASGELNGLVMRGNRLDDTNRLVSALGSIVGAGLLDGSGAYVVRDGVVPSGELVYRSTTTPAPAPGPGLPGVLAEENGRVVAASAVTVAPWKVLVDVPSSELYASLDDQRLRQATGIVLGTVLALIAVVALARRSAAQAWLLAEVAHQRHQAIALEKIAASLSASLQAEGVADVATRQVRSTLAADAVSVGVVDDAGRALTWVGNVGYTGAEDFSRLPLDVSSAATDTVRTGAPVEITGVAEYLARYPHLRPHVDIGHEATWLHWPLLVDERCVGELGLHWRRIRTIDDDDRRFVATVAELLTDALRRTRAYADERDLAQALQRGAVSKVPRITGLVVRAEYRPAAHIAVGGDWFDALALPDGSVFLCVGDVVGHGLDAVEDMVQLRNAARGFAVAGLGPAEILDRLDTFCATVTSGQYATMLVGVLDAAHDRLTIASAGHPPALLRHADGRVERLATVTGSPLGIPASTGYRARDVTLADGATVVLYSDGLVETRTTSLDAGIDRLCDALTAAELVHDDALEHLIAKMQTESGDAQDDVCVLAVQRRESR